MLRRDNNVNGASFFCSLVVAAAAARVPGKGTGPGGYDVAGGPPEREDFGEQTAGGLGEDGGLAAWALFVGKVLGAVVRDATAKDAATGMYILQQVFQIGSL